MDAGLPMIEPARGVLVFALSLTIGFVSIVLLRRFWKWERGLDAGDGFRKLQSKPVLRVGGISLYVVFVLSFFFSQNPLDASGTSPLGLPFLLLGTATFLLGFADDLVGLPASLRLLVQIGVGTAAYLSGMKIDILTHPFGGESIDMGGFSLILTVIWFVAIPNLINLVDGMDGLAGGISLFLCVTLAVLGSLSGNSELLILNLSLSGGIVAFLAFNLPPAKIYMGDGGAYLMGFIVAGSSLISSNKASVFGSLMVVLIVLGFPILDTSLAMLRRGLSGMPIMRADALHLHHRLLTLGFSKRNILFALYGVFAGLSLLGLSVFLTAGYTLPIVGMVAVIGLIQGLRFIGLPHTFTEVRAAFSDVIAARKDVRYAYAMSQVLEHDLERCAMAEEFWNSFSSFMKRLQVIPLSLPDISPGSQGERRAVVLKLDSTTAWIVNCPSQESVSRRWERVVRCFFCPIMGARSRWGRQLPTSLGFVEVDSPEELESLISRLSAGSLPESSPKVVGPAGTGA